MRRLTPGFKYITITAFWLLAASFSFSALGQLGISYQFAKPKEYENKVLQSEKSQDKKFNFSRRVYQNTITRFNYYFNANNKLNDILERAKSSHRDDYASLLPFYNYSPETIAADSVQLDSLTYKSQTGIAIHDLRGDWIDNLYLLWGIAYHYQQKYDSAYLMLQFINYSFAPKKEDGYNKIIGSALDGNMAYSVANKESGNITKKTFTQPPSRNDAFIWQIRNHIALKEYSEANSLITVLKEDPLFPKRLQNDLAEVQAYMHYKLQNWDSSASYLTKALGNATNQHERGRWEYLIGQMYEQAKNFEQAEEFYAKTIKHTTDPVLEIYARLASIRVNKDGGDNYIEENIATLLKMARRDKYTDYRDILYYTAAQMELERKNIPGAINLLERASHYTTQANPLQRNRIFLQLADLSFDSRKYRPSANFYDSIVVTPDDPFDPEDIAIKKKNATDLALQFEIVERQDSIQRIALLPEEERRAYVKKLARQLRKQQGLKEEGSFSTGGGNTLSSSKTPPPSLFNNDNKGEWYFNNNSLKQRGNGDFKSKWGTRPNVDNWRRSSAVAAKGRGLNQQLSNDPLSQNLNATAVDLNQEITSDLLYSRLPLTPELLKTSNDSIQMAQFEIGRIYIQTLEECALGVPTLEAVVERFPEHPKMEGILFNLYYCYNKQGYIAQANAVKKTMTNKFGDSNFTAIINTGKNPAVVDTAVATKAYEDVYDLFIEGNFAQAKAQKKIADSTYGDNYWTPQLLYIESVYYIKQREDSVATKTLTSLINKFNGTPMAAKATNLLDVLSRRQQIEDELTNLVLPAITDDDTLQQTAPTLVIPKQRQLVADSAKAKTDIATIDKNKANSNINIAKPTIQPVKTTAPPVVDTVAKPTIDTVKTTPKIDSVIAKPKPVIDTVKAQPKIDSVIKKPVIDSPVLQTKPVIDSIKTQPKTVDTPAVKPKPVIDTPLITQAPVVKPKPVVADNEYYFDTDAPQYVLIVLNKVDPVFVSEARNAFARYNKDAFFNKTMTAELNNLTTDNRLLLISPFKNVAEATTYLNEVKPKAATDIIPWLKGGKYTFHIISERNLKLLQTTKDVDAYIEFLQKNISL